MDFEYKGEQEEVEMLTWKAPGPDFVQGVWLKNF